MNGKTRRKLREHMRFQILRVHRNLN